MDVLGPAWAFEMLQFISREIELTDNLVDDSKIVLEFWERLRGGRMAPAWADIDLMDLPLHVIPRIVVLDVVQDPLDFVYRFFGTTHASTHGYDLTGKSISKLTPDDYAKITFEQYRATLEAEAPRLFFQQFPTKPDVWCNCETIRLPLSADGPSVDKIMAMETILDDRTVLPRYFEVGKQPFNPPTR